MKLPDGNTREFVDRTVRTVKVQRVYQYASVGLPNLRNDFVCCDKVRDEGPGHEFEVNGQSVLLSCLAESCKAMRKTTKIRIVCCYEDVSCAKPFTGRQECREGLDIRLRPKCNLLQIRNGDASRIQPPDRFTQAIFVFHQRISKTTRCGGQKSNSDVIVTTGRGDFDQFTGRKLERGKRGKRKRGHYSELTVRASREKMFS